MGWGAGPAAGAGVAEGDALGEAEGAGVGDGAGAGVGDGVGDGVEPADGPGPMARPDVWGGAAFDKAEVDAALMALRAAVTVPIE